MRARARAGGDASFRAGTYLDLVDSDLIMRSEDGAMLTVSAILWTLTGAVGAIDGLYFHLYKFRLYKRPESRLEHLAHTVRDILVPPMIWFAFGDSSIAPSLRLEVLIALIAADWLAAAWDVLLEKKSRVELGGMPHFEYFIHVAATGLHSAAEALAIAAWALAGPSATAPLSGPISAGARSMM